MSEQDRYRGNSAQGQNRSGQNRSGQNRSGQSEWQRDYGQRDARFDSASRSAPGNRDYSQDSSRTNSIERDLRSNDYPRDDGFAQDNRFPLDFGANEDRGFSDRDQRSYSDRDREYRGPSGAGRSPEYQRGPLQHFENFGSRTRAEANRPTGLQSANFYGRGPKGYTRSDERIREEVCERLSDNDEVDASDIEVTVRDREVTLEGSVETRRMKHLSEDLADSVSGVEDVHNRITVRKAFLKDVADRVLGNESTEHHAHGGTKTTSAEPALVNAASSSSSNRTANGHS